MKRLLAFLLAIILCTAALAACGSTPATDGASENAGDVTVEE